MITVLLSAVRMRAVRRRRFWCALYEREVEVEFEERGLPGLREAVAVNSCSVFEPPAAVTCGRRCVDIAFRRQWEAPLPIRGLWRQGRTALKGT